MISYRGSFLKFYLDEDKQHLNVPSPIVSRKGRQTSLPADAKKKRPPPMDLKLNLNKLVIDSAGKKGEVLTKDVTEEGRDARNTTTQSGLKSQMKTPNHQQVLLNPIDYGKLPAMQNTSQDFKSDSFYVTENKAAAKNHGFPNNTALNLDMSITQRDIKFRTRTKDARNEQQYSMRQFSQYERENMIDFQRITQQLSQIYKKRQSKKYDFSSYFDPKNLKQSDRYEMGDLVEDLRKEHLRQFKERKQIKQCSEMLKEIRRKRGLDQGFHSLIRNQKKLNDSLINDYQDGNAFGSFDNGRKSVDPMMYDPSVSQIDFKTRNNQAGRTHSNLNQYTQGQPFLKTRTDINKEFQPTRFATALKKHDAYDSGDEDKQNQSELASPTVSTKMPAMPAINSIKKFKQLRESHIRKSMSIITDAENHLRSLKQQSNRVLSHDFDLGRGSRILKPLEISEEDQEILGVSSPMPKIEENESLNQAQENFNKEMNQYILGQPSTDDGNYEKLCSQDLLKSIYEAFPQSNIPVVNMDTFLVERALEEGRSTQMVVGSTWMNLEQDSNSKNTYIRNKMTTKRLMKNIQSISKQSSKVAQQRLMKSVNDAAMMKRRASPKNAHEKKQQQILKNIAKGQSSVSVKQAMDGQTQNVKKQADGSSMTMQAYNFANQSVTSNLDVNKERRQVIVSSDVDAEVEITRKQSQMKRINKLSLSFQDKELAEAKLATDQKNFLDQDALRPTSPDEMTPAQYRAKQVEMMNPFCTFFNQMQTKNKSYGRPQLSKLNPKEQFDVLAIEEDAALDGELVKQIALFDFDDMAQLKYGVFREEERVHQIAQQVIQQRIKKRQLELMRLSSNQNASRGSKNDGVASKQSTMSRKGRRPQNAKKQMSPISEGQVNSRVQSRQSMCRKSSQMNNESRLEISKIEHEQKLSDDDAFSQSASQSPRVVKMSNKRPPSIQTEGQYDLMSHNSGNSYSKIGASFQYGSGNVENARNAFITQMESALPSANEVTKPTSIYNLNCILKVYPMVKIVKMTEFHQANAEQEISYDFDKRVFIDQIEYFLLNAMLAFNARDPEKLVQNMINISYLGLFKNEYQLVMKVYNILGHTFMVWKKYNEAYEYFKKLRDTSKMGQDIETSMYAFKQIGHCLLNMNDRVKALKAFKCQLQVAWHLNHYLGELSSYESIAITYFYLGKLEKARYYMDRFLQGKTEAMFSAVKKISMGFTRRRYKRINILPFKSDEFQPAMKGGKKGEQKLSKYTRELFSKTLKNYSLQNEEVLKNMGFLRRKKKMDEQISDATGQYIEQGSPISNVSLRNLPSPSEVKGQSHLLLMPFYQEIMEEESQKVENQDGNAKSKPQAKKKKKPKQDGDNGAESEASEEAGIDFNTDFQHQKRKVDKNGIIIRKFAISRDELLVTVKSDVGKKSHFGPMNAIRVKQQEKQRHESHVNQIREEQYEKIKRKKRQAQLALFGSSGENQQPSKPKQSIDMEAVIARATAQSQTGASHHLYLSHMSPNRQNKYLKEIEDSHYEQIKNSYHDMLEQVRQEKLRIFVPLATYQAHFKDQTLYTTIPEDNTQQYCFIEELWH